MKMSAYPEDHQNSVPTRTSALIFRLKTHVLQTNRFLQNMADKSCESHKAGVVDAEVRVVGESSTPIWTEADPSERLLQMGKVQNLRTALKKLNGVIVPANATFSFWAQLGMPLRSRGYVEGRELREGCIVPSIAGGLCQLSNALYDAALKANFEIVERHAHSQVIPGSVAEQDRDATIFWNYVDLRFKSHDAFQIEAFLTSRDLVVRLRSSATNREPVPVGEIRPDVPPKSLLAILPMIGGEPHEPNSCMSCGVAECFRSPPVPLVTDAAKTAYLVDEYWSEFDRYITASKKNSDVLFIPINGRSVGKANYAWTTDGFATVKEQPLFTAQRSLESRLLQQQGAARQLVLLRQQKRLAKKYAKSLDFRTTHLVVSQGLLPFLWDAGVLGGRTFDVLMTNLPLAKLHERLDGAKAMHPASTTLGDFRAGDLILQSETQALRQASKIITPHAEIAELFGDRAVRLDWDLPTFSATDTSASDTPNFADATQTSPAQSPSGQSHKTKIVFPASTLGRKGAFELREVTRQLALPIALVGSPLEDPAFWDGVQVEYLGAENWLEQAAVVVLPAWVEQKPRRLLEAVSRGIPVIASRACGLESLTGVTTVKTGDVKGLAFALRAELEKQSLFDYSMSTGCSSL